MYNNGYNFTNEDGLKVLKRFLNKASISFLFPKFARDAKDIE
jgi:hypothetical protein